jgi:hypothetical protein
MENLDRPRKDSAMKHLLCALALLLSISVVVFGQAEQPKQQTDQPTLDETVKWLSQKLPSMAAYEGRFKASTVTLRVISATFDGPSCTLSTQQEIITTGNGNIRV